MQYKIQKYGWVPDLPDHRDHRYSLLQAVSLPQSVDLRSLCPPVYDQGNLGSCTANAIAGALEIDRIKQNLPVFVPSRLFIYYNERAMEGTINWDSGAMIRDGIKSVAMLGACQEPVWEYDISKFTVKPSKGAYLYSRKYKAVQYQRLDNTNITQLKSCLAGGFPFVFGFTVYASFESQQVAQTGVVNLPSPSEHIVGGHAVLCVGYDDASQRFICRNSWGSSWGMNGYFTIPYAYLTNTNLSDDFWAINLVS